MTALTMLDSATPWDANNPEDGLQRLRHVKQIGGIGVTFYIRGTPGGMRHAIKADVDLARSLGLGCMPNWESTSDFFRTATPQQCIDAGKEAFDSMAALGFPLDGSVRVSFSFDYQVPAVGLDRAMGQLANCRKGVASMSNVDIPVSCYGEWSLIQYLGNHNFNDDTLGYWLMGSTWHWNPMVQSDPEQRALYDIGSPYVAAVQSHDLAGNWLNSPVRATDISTVTQPEKLGAWWPDGSPFIQGVDVDLNNPDDVKKLTAIIGKAVFGRQVVADDPKTERDDSVTYGALIRGLRARSLDQLTTKDVAGMITAGLKAVNSDSLTDEQIQQAAEAGLKHVLESGTAGVS